MRVDAFGYVHGDLDGLAVFARVHSLIGPDEASIVDKSEKLS